MAKRDKPDAAIKSMRKGDKLVVTKLDRLAREICPEVGDSVKTLLASGMSKAKVCEDVGISRASLYRIIKDAPQSA